MYSAIILAGGSSLRAGFNKLLKSINDELTVIESSVKVFCEDLQCDQVIVVASLTYQNEYSQILSGLRNANKIEVIIGGPTRHDSSIAGLKVCKNSNVLIHDAARPYLNNALVQRLLNFTLESTYNCVIPVSESVDACVSTDTNNQVNSYYSRKQIKYVQTPQRFYKEAILSAYEKIDRELLNNLFDNASVLKSAFKENIIFIVEGDINNIKITSGRE